MLWRTQGGWLKAQGGAEDGGETGKRRKGGELALVPREYKKLEKKGVQVRDIVLQRPMRGCQVFKKMRNQRCSKQSG